MFIFAPGEIIARPTTICLPAWHWGRWCCDPPPTPSSSSHLEKPGSTVRIRFYDFSSAFSTLQPVLLRNKLEHTGVDSPLTHWIVDYLTNRPQFVRTRDCVSAARGHCKERSWLCSSSPSRLQTSHTTNLPATCRSSLVTLRSSASSQMGMTGSTEN